MKINGIPAVIYGDRSDKVFIYVHGKCGCKEEGGDFASLVAPFGYQVLAADLPCHGERSGEKDGFDPMTAVPELKGIMEYAKENWKEVSLRANSIGAWFSMLALSDYTLCRALFVSPLLDMEGLILYMMNAAGVTEAELKEKRIIANPGGDTLSWEYLCYAREHKLTGWNTPTDILYAGKDMLTSLSSVVAFADKPYRRLTVMENGEHWFHTPGQLEVLADWTRKCLSSCKHYEAR